MLQVAEVNAIDPLETIRLRWTSLLYETPGACLFHTLDWLRVYWQHHRGDRRLRVLLVQRGGNLIGILPLVVRNEMSVAGLVDVLTYPMIGPTPFYGPVGPNPTAILMASLRHLANTPRDWDLLSLACIGEHDHGRTANAMQLAGFSARDVAHRSATKVCLDRSRPELASQRAAEPAAELHALGHKASVAGNVTLERIRPKGSRYENDDSFEQLLDECLALNPAALPAVKSLDNSTAFLRDIVATANRLGMLDLNLLRMNGRLVAFSLNVHFDGALQQILTGQTRESLGFDAARVLIERMLQDSLLRKDGFIYLADSHNDLSTRWIPISLPVIRYQHHDSTPLATRLLRFVRW